MKRSSNCLKDDEDCKDDKVDTLFEHVLDGLLASTLLELLPKKSDNDLRWNIVANLNYFLSVSSLPRDSRIVPFGSFVSSLHSPESDLDLCFEIDGHFLTKELKIVYLKKIRCELIKSTAIKKVELIPQARIPILSFQDAASSIACDVSVNNGSGIFNSNLLRMLLDIDARCRKLVYLIKCWAKAHEINNSKIGSMNSYTITQLVIFHLQSVHPPILPPLRLLFPDNFYKQNKPALIENKCYRENVLNSCERKINNFKNNLFSPLNTQSLSSLFISFFQKYAREHEFWDKRMSISTFFAKWQTKSCIQNEWNYLMLIEDPCDKCNNCARSVREMKKIGDAFQEANDLIQCSKRSSHSSPAHKTKTLLKRFLFEEKAFSTDGFRLPIHPWT